MYMYPRNRALAIASASVPQNSAGIPRYPPGILGFTNDQF